MKETPSLSEATALIYNVDISVNQYQMIRSLCLPHGINLPTRNAVDLFKHTLHPPIFSQELKSSVDFLALLKETAEALIELSHVSSLDYSQQFELIGKFGVDGSGSHKIRHQMIDLDRATEETPHLDPNHSSAFLLTCYCPLSLTCNGKTVWENKVPNSNTFARPVTLTQCKEDRAVLEHEIAPLLTVIQKPTKIMVKICNINCETLCSMLDGKMVNLLQGDSGAFCHLCSSSKADANNIRNIAEGFHINKSYQSCKAAWDKLASGIIAYNDKQREGQVHCPMTNDNLHCISILHYKLRSLDFVQKVLYHLVADLRDWSEKGPNAARVKEAKVKCINHIREKTKLLIDTPSMQGGNTNDGPLADQFFSQKHRQNICELISNDEDRKNFEALLSKLNVLLAITQKNTDKKVNISKCKDIGREIMSTVKSFINEKGEAWINIIPLLHQFCAHSWELFLINDGSSLAKWSECPLEAWNKHVRSFSRGPACRARQNSVKVNIHDIFCRMLIRSHPSVASHYPRPTCSTCGEVGHSARSARHKTSYVPTQEEAEIHVMYL